MIRMLTGLVSFALSRCRRVQPDASDSSHFRPHQDEPRRQLGMPEERARFIAAFLERAFRHCTATSIFCQRDRPFPDVSTGGYVEDINVYESKVDGGWVLNFSLNQFVWCVDGRVDIELKDAIMLRVDSVAPCGSAIRLVFMPEGDVADWEYDLWEKARRALRRREYSELAVSSNEAGRLLARQK